jgi:outer membrane protein
MKKVSRAIFVIAFFSILWIISSVSAADMTKIGVIDFVEILENSTAGKSAQAAINKEGDILKADLEKRAKEIESLREKLERDTLVMSPEKREEQEKDIREKITDLKNLQQKYELDFKKKEMELVKEIQEEVVELVDRIGQKEGYLLILERRECGAVYFPDALDITDRIVELYNQEYIKKQ